jgi:hypothetical protein
MLQIDHIYEFLYQELFKDFEFWSLPNGVPKLGQLKIHDISIFTSRAVSDKIIFFYDQEPAINQVISPYLDIFTWDQKYSPDDLIRLEKNNSLPYDIKVPKDQLDNIIEELRKKTTNTSYTLITSELSEDINLLSEKYNTTKLYYFFHGFAALDWYRGHYALNYNKSIVKQYKHDFISFNRIINNDRSYRIYFVSLLKEAGLLDKGLVSFGVTDDLFDDWQDEVADSNTKLSDHARQHSEQHLTDISKLMIDKPQLPGSASADIPRGNNVFWHIVTETVFYYEKLHLTEKIFKPIVSKQPFMLLAAPGNLAYLKSYGFKTFDTVIDESYDTIQDNDLRTEAVVRQLHWYCNLTPDEKTDIIQQLAPIIDYNFHHFYGEFRHIITRELLDNTKTLFQSIGYDDSHINYANIHHVLTH